MSPMKKMPGKRVQFEETCEAIEAVVRDSGSSFQRAERRSVRESTKEA
jgi:hypothetical protein